MKEQTSSENIHKLVSTRYARNVNKLHQERLSFGDRVADRLADLAGSWGFIITFMTILLLWIAMNSIQLIRPYDPYPFILLNLVLSCIAAIQAPIIMMSQNRQEAKDRLQSEHDYDIDLKAEILIEEILQRLERLEKNQETNRLIQSKLVELLEAKNESM
jgi:uncharacterized membrane protein